MLESGRAFRGTAIGAEVDSFGEVVFNTSLSGYQEILTDPSYAGQIIVMTATQIGNTLASTTEDVESDRLACAGFVVREVSPIVSNWRSERRPRHLSRSKHGIAGIEGIDTRALTRAIRDGGAQRGVIATSTADVDALLDRVAASPSMEGRDLVPEVTCAEPYEWDTPSWQAPDLDARPVPHRRHCTSSPTTSASSATSCATCATSVSASPCCRPRRRRRSALALNPDGLFLSNGPGDPAAVDYGIEAVRELVGSGVSRCSASVSAIRSCRWRWARAPTSSSSVITAATTRSKDIATGKVEITSQNHGFAVDIESLGDAATCTHINLYDDTVEGIRLIDKPVFGVQYHPEASPGPHDASYLFQRFVDAMRS